MVRELMHDPLFLGRKSRTATREDLPIGQDLLETLLAHRATCVGMAGNMIGETVAVIAFFDGDKPMVMYNPEILKAETGFIDGSTVNAEELMKLQPDVVFYHASQKEVGDTLRRAGFPAVAVSVNKWNYKSIKICPCNIF